MHVRDVWAVHEERDKMVLVEEAIKQAVDVLRSRKYIKKRKADEKEIGRLAKKSRGSGYQHPIAASDSDVWFVSILFDVRHSHPISRLRTSGDLRLGKA